MILAVFCCFSPIRVRNKLDIVQTDVVDDPTLQRSKNAICEKCNYNEAVFFQADEVRPFPRMERYRSKRVHDECRPRRQVRNVGWARYGYGMPLNSANREPQSLSFHRTQTLTDAKHALFKCYLWCM